MSYFHLPGPELLLPWYSTEDEDFRFKKILKRFLIAFLVLSVIVYFYPVKEKTREEKETLPPVLARVVLEKKELPPPPKPKPKPEPKKLEPKKPEPKKPEPKKPEPKKPEPKKPEPKPKPVPKPKPKPVKIPKPVKPKVTQQQRVERAQREAQKELNQVKDVFADLQNLNVDTASNNNVTKGASDAKRLDRSVITNKSRTSSGGINAASLSRDTGGSALSGRETTQVSSSLADRKRAADAKKTGVGRDGQRIISRSNESVRKVMDRNKSSIFTTYQRALRKNPSLEGVFVVKLVIEPSGRVSSATVVSSELDDAALEKKLLDRIKLINFGSANASRTTVNYDLNFVPPA
ncbi:MAG: AgmX/PglI C-terminal domain-containing protein [Cellvibrionaceae bacterium]